MSLDHACELCKAPKGEPCVWTLRREGDPRPAVALPGRSEHFARALPPGQSKQPEKRNEALV